MLSASQLGILEVAFAARYSTVLPDSLLFADLFSQANQRALDQVSSASSLQLRSLKLTPKPKTILLFNLYNRLLNTEGLRSRGPFTAQASGRHPLLYRPGVVGSGMLCHAFLYCRLTHLSSGPAAPSPSHEARARRPTPPC